jgi:lysozyme
VSAAVTVPLNDNEFGALTSFTFNLGIGNLKSSTLLKKLNAGDRAGAADEFGKWVNAGGKPLPGLVKRRAAERALFLTPV